MKKGIDFIGIATGALVINNEGKVLIARRGPQARNERGKWDFPGGSVDFGEKLVDAVRREIKEEFDIDVEVISMLEVVDHILPEEKQHWVGVTYLVQHVAGEPKLMEPHKVDLMKWVDLSELDIDTLTMTTKSNVSAYKRIYGDKPLRELLLG